MNSASLLPFFRGTQGGIWPDSTDGTFQNSAFSGGARSAKEEGWRIASYLPKAGRLVLRGMDEGEWKYLNHASRKEVRGLRGVRFIIGDRRIEPNARIRRNTIIRGGGGEIRRHSLVREEILLRSHFHIGEKSKERSKVERERNLCCKTLSILLGGPTPWWVSCD